MRRAVDSNADQLIVTVADDDLTVSAAVPRDAIDVGGDVVGGLLNALTESTT